MISVLPGQSFLFKNPNQTIDINSIIADVTKLISGASPFLESVEFKNKTRHCSIDIAFTRGKIIVTFKNPQDEVFDLNDMENPVTPIQITGR